MDEGSSYCGCGSKIEISDAVKITNMVVTGAVWIKDSVESNMKPRFLADRLGMMSWVEGKKREGF